MSQFILENNKWYACTLISESFTFEVDRCTYSPIRILAIESSPEHKDIFTLTFYHANYPEGVRTKVYELQTLERGQSLLFARCLGYEQARFMMIYNLTKKWLLYHFPMLTIDQDDIQEWLEENIRNNRF